jgi:hypothetical protein
LHDRIPEARGLEVGDADSDVCRKAARVDEDG